LQVTIFIVTVLYFALMLGIGYWAKKKTKSSKDFLVAGQSIGFFAMAIATFASIQSGWGMFGTSGTIYGWGIQAIFTAAILTPLGFLLAWALLGTRIQKIASRYEVYSVPDIIKIRYGNKAAHITISIAMFVGSIGYMTTQISATGLIMSLLFDIPFQWGAWIGAIIVAIYTIFGGMLAAIWTDMIQGMMMILMSIVIFVIAMGNVGGWSSALDSLYAYDSTLITVMGVMPLTWVFSNTIMITFGAVGQPQLVTKFLMIKDKKQLKWGAFLSGFAYSFTIFFVLGIGLSMKALVAEGHFEAFDNVDLAVTNFFSSSDIITPLVAGLGLVTLLAAIMSSASSFITIGASAIMRDLASAFNILIKRDLLWGRIYSGVVVLLSVFTTLYLDQIIYIMGAFGWASFAAAVFGPIVIGLYWKRATGIAAFLSMLVGLLFNLVFTILTSQGYIEVPDHFFTGGITFSLGILVFVFLSYLTKSETDQDKFDNLYGPSEYSSKKEVLNNAKTSR